MKLRYIYLLALLGSLELPAYTNFIENPYTPYPASCISAPEWWFFANEPDWVKFHQGTISLKSATPPYVSRTAVVKAYRAVCAEENRSLVWLQFTTPTDHENIFYQAPEVRARLADGRSVLMSLSQAPGSWNLSAAPSASAAIFGFNNCIGNNGYCSRVGWAFVLDNANPLLPGISTQTILSSGQYNDGFQLELKGQDFAPVHVINVPPTNLFSHLAPRVPLSGRLSGSWVIEGAADQGLALSIAEIVSAEPAWLYEAPYAAALKATLTWYTFDSQGDMLWISGSADFSYGATEISMPLELASQGEFQGSQTAERRIIGSVKITGNNCNDLSFEYDLTELGLGSGSEHLKRLFALETAGYTCRDLDARMKSLQVGTGQ